MSVIRNQSDQIQQGWLFFLDQQKAFNHVNHEYLQGVLIKMKFDPSFIQIIIALFSKQTAYTADLGIISEPFKVNCGHSRKQKFKLTAYADDLTVGIASQAEWDVITKIIQKYENAFNAKINKIK
ncbi:15986_t:CDS:2 [Gigaspora rosea]|nr:15986_t:CDS:2 [Gigaspora rosea]